MKRKSYFPKEQIYLDSHTNLEEFEDNGDSCYYTCKECSAMMYCRDNCWTLYYAYSYLTCDQILISNIIL